MFGLNLFLFEKINANFIFIVFARYIKVRQTQIKIKLICENFQTKEKFNPQLTHKLTN